MSSSTWCRHAVASVVLAIVGLAATPTDRGAQREQDPGTAIREQRAEWNRAGTAHDSEAMGRTVAADFRRSGPVQQIDGRSAMRSAFTRLFATRPDLSYQYHITRIDAFVPWNYAAETGTWEERWTDRADRIQLSGTYLTLWRRDGDTWLQQSETFVPLACTGGRYCDADPDTAQAPLASLALNQYAGLFRSDVMVLEVRREDDELVLRMSTGASARLIHRPSGVFQLERRAGVTVSFSRLDGGRFTRLELRQGDRITLQATRLP
jgi:ketosteroid isomerase-like protein